MLVLARRKRGARGRGRGADAGSHAHAHAAAALLFLLHNRHSVHLLLHVPLRSRHTPQRQHPPRTENGRRGLRASDTSTSGPNEARGTASTEAQTCAATEPLGAPMMFFGVAIT
eukprot:3600192-Rhodomonas_salina.2